MDIHFQTLASHERWNPTFCAEKIIFVKGKYHSIQVFFGEIQPIFVNIKKIGTKEDLRNTEYTDSVRHGFI